MTKPLVRSFLPVANSDARLLILGSMPGKRSLAENEYYAHPANAFWRIMRELCGATSDNYRERLEILKSSGIALWDVLDSCERLGSLDADIKNERANDFTQFFAHHPHITHVFFNGGKAEQAFKKHALQQQALPPLEFCRLPSTSPAHAGMRFADKLDAWRAILPHMKPRL